MEQIPFFTKLNVWGPIISGIILFIFSFSKKQYYSMIEGLGENTGRKAHKVLRYGGPLLVFCGISLVLLSQPPSTGSNGNTPEVNEQLSQLTDANNTVTLQKNAGSQDGYGWFNSLGGEGVYSVLFPGKITEYKLPVKNNKTCSFYYSASTKDTNAQYIVEYIKCMNLNIESVANNIRNIQNANVLKVEEIIDMKNVTFDVVEKTQYGKAYTRSIIIKTGQFSLIVRPTKNHPINMESLKKFYNSFKIN